MSKFSRITSLALGGIMLLATTSSFATTGTVNAPNGLILREEASTSGKVITTISDDSNIEIIEESNEWYKVKYNNYEGFVFAEYVDVEATEQEETTTDSEEEQNPKDETEQTDEKETSTEENPNTEEQTYPQKQTVKTDLKIYTIPSVTANEIETVKKDSEVTVNYELNNWVNITYGDTQGWARKYFINNEIVTEETRANSEEKDTEQEAENTSDTSTDIENKKGYIDVSTSANIRKEASTSSDIINTLLRNTEVTIIAEEGDFYKIQYQNITGYISKSLISDSPVGEITSRSSGERKINTTQSEEKASTTTTNSNENVSSNSSVGNDIVAYAKKYIGYDYVYGGTSPSNGFDCSGFVYYVYNSCGYSLSRSCQVQAKSGTSVSKNNLAAGDLVFFNNGSNGSIGHVGIYIGEGRFIHAENSKTGVRTDTLNSGYYNKYYYSARRIIK